MSKAEEFIRDEKERFGKVYVDISFAIDNISPFLEEKALGERRYAAKLPILKKYIELLQAAEGEIKKEGFFSIFSNDKYTDLIKDYKQEHHEVLNQLVKCRNCRYLNYTGNGDFDGCLGCRDGSMIARIEDNKLAVVVHDNFIIDLINNKTGIKDKYIVLATVQDIEKDKRYILIEGIRNKDKFILYYYPGISEDNYGEITDETEFDYIASIYESLEI